MGRLFWKFFFFLMLAQVTTIVGVSFAIWLRHTNSTLAAATDFARPPPRFAEEREPPPPHPPRTEARSPDGPGRPTPLRFPLEPMIGGLIVSLAAAALIAWYVAKPIRNLRRAFDAAAQGNLDVRVGEALGRRRDELADLGRDFDRTAAQLKVLMEGQRRLLHDISHELRSPLARLQAAVGLARQEPGSIDASMDRIEREAVRMDKLVDELLTLSRVEAGMGPERKEQVRLVELVADVVEDATFEVNARSMSVTFATEVSPLESAVIEGNREMLHRALENVVRNAARYSPAGGRVRITGRHDVAAHFVELAIADEGPGVAATELVSIFDPFFRGSAAPPTQGHGLGLAIARRVVEAHGGHIVAANRPAGGLAVTIRLPA